MNKKIISKSLPLLPEANVMCCVYSLEYSMHFDAHYICIHIHVCTYHILNPNWIRPYTPPYRSHCSQKSTLETVSYQHK